MGELDRAAHSFEKPQERNEGAKYAPIQPFEHSMSTKSTNFLNFRSPSKIDIVRSIFDIDLQTVDVKKIKVRGEEYYNITGESDSRKYDLGFFDINSTDKVFASLTKMEMSGRMINKIGYKAGSRVLKVLGSNNKIVEKSSLTPYANNEAIVMLLKKSFLDEGVEEIFSYYTFADPIVYVDEEFKYEYDSVENIFYNYLLYTNSLGAAGSDKDLDEFIGELVETVNEMAPEQQLFYWRQRETDGTISEALFEHIEEFINIKHPNLSYELEKKVLREKYQEGVDLKTIAKGLIFAFENSPSNLIRDNEEFNRINKATIKYKESLSEVEKMLLGGLGYYSFFRHTSIMQGDKDEPTNRPYLEVAINEIVLHRDYYEKQRNKDSVVVPVLDFLDGKLSYQETVNNIHSIYLKEVSKRVVNG